MLDLLLVDEGNPRSVIFQVNSLVDHIGGLPRDTAVAVRTPEQRLSLELRAELQLADIEALAAPTDGVRAGWWRCSIAGPRACPRCPIRCPPATSATPRRRASCGEETREVPGPPPHRVHLRRPGEPVASPGAPVAPGGQRAGGGAARAEHHPVAGLPPRAHRRLRQPGDPLQHRGAAPAPDRRDAVRGGGAAGRPPPAAVPGLLGVGARSPAVGPPRRQRRGLLVHLRFGPRARQPGPGRLRRAFVPAGPALPGRGHGPHPPHPRRSSSTTRAPPPSPPRCPRSSRPSAASARTSPTCRSAACARWACPAATSAATC